MINKRHFLMGGASAVAAAPGLALDAGQQLAETRPRLDAQAGLATWQAYLGQEFLLGEARVMLASADARDPQGLQFSLVFKPLDGPMPAAGLLLVRHPEAQSFPVFVAATPTGVRADFCRRRD